MSATWSRTVCWTPVWNKDREGAGLEHLLLAEHVADSVVLAFDEEQGPFRLTYRLAWDEGQPWRVTGQTAGDTTTTSVLPPRTLLDTDAQQTLNIAVARIGRIS